ncbi:MAG: DNA-directed RNA polymerase subunit omega [Bacteriodetes bacterium]|nr:DNA-directed RNA polymerase subunit omega [Bacteroidota bacterium]
MSLSHISIVNPVEVKMKESKRGSLYEAIVAMGLRARQVNDQIKQQLQARMADVITDGDESEGTNFDQLAISREFDSIAKPTFIAMREMFDDKVKYEMPVEVKPEED